jgi:hypothetical protein
MAAFLSRERTAGKSNPHRGENLIGGIGRITVNRRSLRIAAFCPPRGSASLVGRTIRGCSDLTVARVNHLELETISSVGWGA